MNSSLDARLIVAISSRALFNFEEENGVFESQAHGAYQALQRQRLEVPAAPGVATPGAAGTSNRWRCSA